MAGRLLAILMFVCLLVGCAGGDPEHSRSTDARGGDRTTQKSGTPDRDQPQNPVDQSPNPPELPRAARQDSLAGAEAFVRHYVELLNYASATGKVGSLNDAARNCTGCGKYADLYRETYAEGGYMKGGGWTPTAIDLVRQDEIVTVAFLTVRASRMHYKLSSDSEQKVGRSDVFRFRLELTRDAEEWKVTDLGLQAESQDL